MLMPKIYLYKILANLEALKRTRGLSPLPVRVVNGLLPC
ncbi:hypothetical protein APA_4795 [Pseudanabaena sp. lw0831]|nr:hypothetical protein APA_4795 [Pseudanabaena sp. lw0831]